MRAIRVLVLILCSSIVLLSQPTGKTEYDLVIRNGIIYDGLGTEGYRGDVAIRGDRIAALGKLDDALAKTEVDVRGLAVAPGFINMLSWAVESLIVDGRGLSDIVQGVTLEVMGEGWSMGPLNEDMKKEALARQSDIRYPIEWTTLSEYLEWLATRGISPNIASFVGATTLRIHEIGYENRAPTGEELERMKILVKQAMEEGALGIGSSLIYAPAFYSKTGELIELCKVAGSYGGMYISHMRSEGNRIMESLNELIRISREAAIPAEIYHLKMGGRQNWGKFSEVIGRIEAARAEGLRITADMYTYTAGATGLNAAMPPWVQEGGLNAWTERLKQPEIRRRVLEEMNRDAHDWENLFYAAGPEGILLTDFKKEDLRSLRGKTLAEVARMRATTPAEAAMDLVVEDNSRVGAIYFLMNEENVKKQIALPFVSFGSDAAALAPEGLFIKSNTHPRAYGNVARLLGKYVRDQKVIPLREAVRRLTSLPAGNLGIKERGRLATGYFADIAVFDPARVQDHATYKDSHRLATGMVHVFVNGIQVLKDGVHTGATPGRVVRGPGYKTPGSKAR